MIEYVHETRIAASAARVFAFHERPDVFKFLIPSWPKTTVVSRSGGLEVGARVEFLFHLGPCRVPWTAVHSEYVPGRLFVDVQESGPFASWEHRHEVLPDGEGSILRDTVRCSLPLGMDWVAGWLVRRELRKMFIFRHAATVREVLRET